MGRKTVLRVQGAVIIRPVQPHLSEQFQSRVLIRRHYHFSEHCRLLPHRDLQSCHGTGFNIETLGVITDGGEDEPCFGVHVHTQNVRTARIRGSTDLGALEMNIDIRDSFARRLVEHLADNNGLGSRNRWSTEYRVQSTDQKSYKPINFQLDDFSKL